MSSLADCKSRASAILVTMALPMVAICASYALVLSVRAPARPTAQRSSVTLGAKEGFAVQNAFWDKQMGERLARMGDRRAKYMEHASTIDMAHEEGRTSFFQGMWGVVRSELQLIQGQLRLAPGCLASGAAEVADGTLAESELLAFKEARKRVIIIKNQKISVMRRLDEVRQASQRVQLRRRERDKLRVDLAEAEAQLAAAESTSTEEVNRCSAFLGRLIEAGFDV